ncbi:hypothetical protein KIPB_006780 [Kipferlia bialata]|uniref:CCHC-type domain-containing protein n=1 Tax=Kipferlia bialata TaxID=797122 RepID=A0A9K3GJH7_9EUKA|nr:hypothetical protein KIPB_006780 [Kipferlia bialata]|eukprot:g6780.t1
MRLSQVLSKASGACGKNQTSAKDCSKAVCQGRVSVAGEVVTDPTYQALISVLLGAESVTLDGAPVDTSLIFHRLLIYHKPAGTVCTGAQSSALSIFHTLTPTQQHPTLTFFGRLDRDTTGLMLLGTDGGVGHLLTSPDTHVSKQYWALLKRVSEGGDPLWNDPASCKSAVDMVARGVVLSDGTVCRPAELCVQPVGCQGPVGSALRRRVLKHGAPVACSTDACKECGMVGHWARDCPTAYTEGGDHQPCVSLVLHEGKFHQVKKVLGACNGCVVRLHREAIGPLRLSELEIGIPVGTARPPTPSELQVILGMMPIGCRSAGARRERVSARRAETGEV